MRGEKGKFQKGHSGNPGGRPKECEEVKALARVHTKEAIDKLAAIMRDGEERAAVAACNSLLDRGWGKPAQQIDHGLATDKPFSIAIIHHDGSE